MPRITRIEFDTPATVGELIEALEDLRARFGADAIVRTTNYVEFNTAGTRVKSVTASRLTKNEG